MSVEPDGICCSKQSTRQSYLSSKNDEETADVNTEPQLKSLRDVPEGEILSDDEDTAVQKTEAEPSNRNSAIFIEAIRHLETNATKEVILSKLGPQLVYDVDEQLPGLALVINNEFKGQENERRESCHDYDELILLLKSMNFKIHDEGNTTNLKANEMGDKLKEVSEKPDFQSLLVFIMSHGAAALFVTFGAENFVTGPTILLTEGVQNLRLDGLLTFIAITHESLG
ncbi:uncharacterized protein LOC134853702 [Symsagittifera roscoffensis]|uniref:uncharacterized protein LOC134853702 n=1 Tax=Symsagittifera roscoffensis TaxID=84072 RepID=UPI00307C8222